MTTPAQVILADREPVHAQSSLECNHERPSGSAATGLGPALRQVFPAWLTARLIVLAAVWLAHLVIAHLHPSHADLHRVHQGLLGWDAAWYQGIATHGYSPLGDTSVRFFPLLPMLTRALSALPWLSAGTALLLIANVSALLGSAMLLMLVRRESGDGQLARRTVWLLCLAPPAFTLAMGYAEGTFLVLSVGCFLALRARPTPRWWWVAATAFLAALSRPLGVLLVLPIAIEVVRFWLHPRSVRRFAPTMAVLSPLAGIGAFLAWSAVAFGAAWRPILVQTRRSLHGKPFEPITAISHYGSGLIHNNLGTTLNFPWLLLAIALLVVCWQRLPACYSIFATGVVAAALSGTTLHSFGRYALSAFPLIWAGSMFTASRRVERSVLVLAAGGLVLYALLAFLNLLIP